MAETRYYYIMVRFPRAKQPTLVRVHGYAHLVVGRFANEEEAAEFSRHTGIQLRIGPWDFRPEAQPAGQAFASPEDLAKLLPAGVPSAGGGQ